MIDYELENPIIVWYHKQDEPSWENDSYIQIYHIKTLIDYIRFKNSFSDLPQFLNGFYFFMKEGIHPTWEDPKNIGGGCFNIKVAKDQIEKYMWNVLRLLLINSISKGNNNTITGISVVPKKYNAVVKVWNSDSNENTKEILNPLIQIVKDDDIFYRSHVENDTFKQVHNLS